MAGHRRTRGQPLRSVTRTERRIAWVDVTVKAAETPEKKVTAAANALRGAIKRANPTDAAVAAAKASKVLTSLARHLVTRQAKRKAS